MRLSLPAELLLLVLDDASGKPMVDSTKLKAAMAGATVVELALDGVLRLAGPGDEVRPGRLVRTGATVDDPLLEEIAGLAHGRRPKDVVSRVGGATAWKDRAGAVRSTVLDELVRDGVLRHESGKVLGLFPTNAWPLQRPEVEGEVVARVRTVVVDRRQPDDRTGALVALCSAVDLLPRLFPDQPKKQVRERGREVASGDWGAAAVTKAVQEVQAAVMAAVVAATTATTASS